MHLKTILIFCSFCFFTGIISEGLNVFQINLFEYLITDYNIGRSIEKIQHALFCHDIEETYNDYNLDDRVSIRIFKILNFLARIKKRGDDKRIEKLDINEFQIISNKFSNLDTDNDCVLNKEQCITLVESIGYCHSSSGFVIINLFKNIHNYVHTRYIAYDFFSLHKNSTANIDFEKIIINKIIKIYAHEL
ncbi:uncharacterized protein LOC126908843 isoform X1 [Daktulosphaira vitifoliae]|uniref:uncharacterized protein LOC126908843 isoform X1 n=1 Tax=Daktulosphaira vitifoliae TaxID=58002 RepID=UPI0021AA531B|nr:uncharacterized protein LOC126908843 isoform X1 [Daktulosphaira vitifoliae]